MASKRIAANGSARKSAPIEPEPPQPPQITCDQWAEKVAAYCCHFWVKWADTVLGRLNEEHAKFTCAHQTDSAEFLHVSVQFINKLRTEHLTDWHNGTTKRVFLDAHTRYSPETLIEATDNEISTSVLLAMAAMPTPTTVVDELLKRATRKLVKLNVIDWLGGILSPATLDEVNKEIAKALANKKRPMPSEVSPHWSEIDRTLTYDGVVVKSFARRAPNQFLVLQGFQESRWPREIADPLYGGKCDDPVTRLIETVKSLNENQNAAIKIRFKPNGRGNGICWDVKKR